MLWLTKPFKVEASSKSIGLINLAPNEISLAGATLVWSAGCKGHTNTSGVKQDFQILVQGGELPMVRSTNYHKHIKHTLKSIVSKGNRVICNNSFDTEDQQSEIKSISGWFNCPCRSCNSALHTVHRAPSERIHTP